MTDRDGGGGAPPSGVPPIGAPPSGAPPIGAPPIGAPPVQANNEGGDPFAEFEDELQGESTRIDTEHLLAEEATTILHQAPERPFLRVAKGKDQGKEFFLNPGETGVGRSIDNDVILTDIAVSRRHLKIHLSDAGLLKIIDLGSGNGSTVNGSRVKEAPLNQGDRIELGETTLVVEIPGQASLAHPGAAPLPGAPMGGGTTDEDAAPSLPPGTPTAGVPGPGLPPHPGTPVSTDYIPAPAVASGTPLGIPKPWLFAFLAVAGVIVALVGATITALVIRDDGDPGSGAGTFNEAVVAFENQRWDEAQEAFQQHLEDHNDDVATQQYLERIGQVRRDLAAVSQAEEALAANPPNGQEALNQLASITTESPVYATTVAPLRARATEAHILVLRDEGVAAAQDGNRRLAIQNAEYIRELQSPSAEAAAADIDSALGGEPVARVTTMRRSGSMRSGSSTMRSGSSTMRSGSSTMRSGSSAMASPVMTTMRRGGGSATARARREVITLYERGQFGPAANLARQKASEFTDRADYQPLTQLADNIVAFERAYTQARRRNASASQINRAIRLDQNISGGHFAGQLRGGQIEASLRAANAAFSSNNYQGACRAIRNAFAADPQNASARRGRERCIQQGATLIARARRVERSDPREALSLYRQVVNISPVGSNDYQEALRKKNQLAAQLRDEDE